MESSFKPVFFSSWESVEQSLISNPPTVEFCAEDLRSVFQSQNGFLLNRLVRFNNQYYCKPTVPAFPSLAFENMVVQGGVQRNGTSKKKNIDTAFLAITSQCHNNCIHCFEKKDLEIAPDIAVEKWIEAIAPLQNQGTSVIVFTGGEPLSRFDDLITILHAGNKDLSDFHLHTSGYSLTAKKVQAFKEAGLKAAAISFDDHSPRRFEWKRNKGSYQPAVDALRMFNEAGVMTYVNLLATKELIYSEELYEYYEFVKELNVSFIQLLEPKPCGKYLSKYANALLNAEEREILLEFTKQTDTNDKYKDGPIVYNVSHIHSANQAGCMAGLSRFYIDSAGNVDPCMFLPISFGNIMEERFEQIFNNMREIAQHTSRSGCRSLRMADVLRKYPAKDRPIPFDDIEADWVEKF